MLKSGAEIITTLLERQGVQTVAGIPGGSNLPLYDALAQSSIHHVLARHEQGAGFIAQGMARVTGKAGVCIATSGPGATNLLTALADAKLDSVPLVAITGQVPRGFLNTDAFQEVDTVAMATPVTKARFLAESAVELLTLIPRAFAFAESGRPGPVLIDVPKDVFLERVEFSQWPAPWHKPEARCCYEPAIDKLAEWVCASKRPVLLVGGGAIAAEAGPALRAVAEKADIPVVSTIMGLGVFPAEHPLYQGMVGMHGDRHVNLLFDEADLVIACGTRLGDRATGKVSAFCPKAKLAHLDIDAREIGKIREAHLPVMGDVRMALEQLEPRLKQHNRAGWHEAIQALCAESPDFAPEPDHPLDPVMLMRRLGAMLNPEDIITTDVGQHQMWVAQAYPFRRPRTWLTSAGLGTMGFGLPAAIGAALARPDRQVVCVSGDGSFLMNPQELATLREENLPVKVLILNNGHLGLVRQQQELFYGSRFHAVAFQARPSFARMAEVYGINGLDITPDAAGLKRLQEGLLGDGPCVMDIPIPPEWKVYPMVSPGAANRDMLLKEPPASLLDPQKLCLRRRGENISPGRDS